MADAEICSQIRSFLVDQKSQPFALEFLFNNRLYKTVLDASHNLDQIYVSNKCVGMEYDKGAFIGFIEANSKEKRCFDPILITEFSGTANYCCRCIANSEDKTGSIISDRYSYHHF